MIEGPATNKRIALIAAAAMFAPFATPASAQTEEFRSGFYIAPVVNAVRTDDDRAVDDGAAFTLATGYALHPRWNLELNLFRGRFDGTGGDDLTLDAAGLNVLHVFRRDARVAPFLLAGVGALRKDREIGASSTDAYGDAGAGFLTRLRRSKADGNELFLRVDARARYDHADGDGRLDYLFGIGLQYAFGAAVSDRPPPPPAAPAEPPPPPADGDGDGVPDDRDGCPGTPPGAAVDADGCELDSDGDGIVDSADACPGRPEPGGRANARGCDLEAEIRLPRVTFDFDSDRLQPGAYATLDEAVETLRMNADLAIEVAGHTDSRGPDGYNRDLSQRRAEAVRRYLLDGGVTNQVTARGYGEREPIADNTTEAGRSQNRRVVLRVLEP